MNRRTWGVLALASFTLSAIAETTTTAAAPVTTGSASSTPAVQTTLPGAAPAPSVTFTGNVDLRPSVQATDGFAYSEDAVEVGLRFAPGRSITYVQTFFTAEPGTEQNVLKLTTSPGFLKSKVGNFAKLPGGIDVSYENRIYVPTWEVDRTRGQIVTFRNYIKFNKDFGSKFSLTFMELPIFHIFSKSGNGAASSPSFENRFYLVATFNITDKITAYLPVMFHQTLHRSFAADTRFSGAWSFFAWMNPEIYYQVSQNFSLGLGYYSGNMVAGDLSQLTLSEGLKNGVFQVAANVSI